jgi:hypothetical protein
MNETSTRRIVKPEASTKYELTDPQLFSPKKNYDEASASLITFVEEQISKMRDNVLFDEAPTFYQLNTALASYESILLALLSSYASARMQANVAQEIYDDKWAACVVETKTKFGLNKYTSSKEIEYAARVAFIKELSKLKAAVIRAENERSFVERLVDGWKNYGFILGTLSRNAQAEASATRISTNDLVGDLVGDQP